MLHLIPLFALALAPAEATPSPSPLPPIVMPAASGEELATSGQEQAAVPAKPWSGALNVGISRSTGNSEVDTLSIQVDAIKDLERQRYSLGLWYFYAEQEVETEAGETDDQKSKDEGGIKAQGDFFFDEARTNYWYVEGSAQMDDVANINSRTTAGVGVGRQFRSWDLAVEPDGSERQHGWNVSGEAGLTYYTERTGPVMQGDGSFDNEEDSYLAARLAYKVGWKNLEGISFSHEAEILPSLEDTDDIYARSDTRLSTNLTDSMFAQLQWILQYDNTPADGSERVDNLYLLTIGWSF